MPDKFSPFLENSDLNIFEILLTSVENDTIYHFMVDDFHFMIKKHDTSYEFETSDEFLIELNSSIIKTSSDPLELIQRVSDAYGDLFGEKSPLYNNQDVFELENDNHDMKFIARMRFTEDDIHSDVFSKVFDFLSLGDLLMIRRASKKFNQLATLGTIWKKFCSEIVEDGDYFSHYLKVEIFPKVSWVSTSDRTIVDKKFNITSSILPESCADVMYTTMVNSGVHDLDIHLQEQASFVPQDLEDEYDGDEDYGQVVAIGVFGNDMDWSKWKNDGQGQCICENNSLPLNYLWYWQSRFGDFTRYSYDTVVGESLSCDYGMQSGHSGYMTNPKKWSKTTRIRLDCDKRTLIIDDEPIGSLDMKSHCTSFGICVIHCSVDNQGYEMVAKCSLKRHVK